MDSLARLRQIAERAVADARLVRDPHDCQMSHPCADCGEMAQHKDGCPTWARQTAQASVNVPATSLLAALAVIEALEGAASERAEDEHIRGLTWHDDTPTWARALVAGNVRHVFAKMRAALAAPREKEAQRG